MDTPRPSLIVDGVHRSRAKTMDIKARYKRILSSSADDETKIRKILAAHRRRQTCKLGRRDSDPDPYAPTYIFYCLDGVRTE